MGVMPILVEKRELDLEEIGGRGIRGWFGHRGERGISALLSLYVMPNELHVYFLSNLGQGGPPSFIHRIAQDVQEAAIPKQPPRKGTGEKGGRVMTW